LIFAHHLHATQKRKGTAIPYMAHLLSVAALVLEDGGAEDEAIAALLHDAVGDQGGAATRQEIRKRGSVGAPCLRASVVDYAAISRATRSMTRGGDTWSIFA